MKSATTILAAIVGMAGLAVAQGVTSAIAPEATAPAGCSASYDGTFEITVAKVYGAAKRDEPIAVSGYILPPPSIFQSRQHGIPGGWSIASNTHSLVCCCFVERYTSGV